MAIKKLWERYKKPTPAKWRRIGDSLLGLSGAILAYETYFQDQQRLLFLAAAIGVLGKFITNFAVEEPKESSENNV